MVKNEPHDAQTHQFLSSLQIDELNSNDLTLFRCYDIMDKYAEISLSGKLGMRFYYLTYTHGTLFKFRIKFKKKSFYSEFDAG